MPGLYLHIPFCVRKCLYCDFYSIPTGRGPLPTRLAEVEDPDQSPFLRALAVELKSLPASFKPETVFVGGGTPTELSDHDLGAFFELLHRSVDLSAVTEWTCESNPGTLTASKARILRDAGVNRVSLGVQSFDPVTLDFLGRIHSADEAERGYELLRAEGFDNINLDLIYAVPGLTRAALEASLDRLVALRPDHAACYGLIFEDGTPLADLRHRGFVREVEDDEELEQYQLVIAKLAAAGYGHYEISNYAQPGRECRHNLLYWSGGEYNGLGPSAHSHWAGKRWGNIRDLDAYTRRLLAGEGVRAFEEELDSEAKARETLIMSLRQLRGVSREAFLQQTGFDYRQLCAESLPWLVREGLLVDEAERLRLTPRGLFLSDGIFAELV